MEPITRAATLHNVDASLPERASVTLVFDDGAFRMLSLDPPAQASALYRHVGQRVLAVYYEDGVRSRALWVGALVSVPGLQGVSAVPPGMAWEGSLRVDQGAPAPNSKTR